MDYLQQGGRTALEMGEDLVFAKQAKSIRTRRPKNTSKR
jgi:hypothetical protein